MAAPDSTIASIACCTFVCSSAAISRAPLSRRVGDSIPQAAHTAPALETDQLERDRRASRLLEEPQAIAKQNRRHMHQHLVEQAGMQTLPRDAGSKHHDALPAGCRESGPHTGRDLARQEHESSIRRRFGRAMVMTMIGPLQAPPYGAASGSSCASSYHLRPARMAPVVRTTSSTAAFGHASGPNAQAIESSGPAMKPSRDIVTCQRTWLQILAVP